MNNMPLRKHQNGYNAKSNVHYYTIFLCILTSALIYCKSIPKESYIQIDNRDFGTIAIASWNIQDLGRTKDASEVDIIVNIIRGVDLIAIQEVVAGRGGPNAIKRIRQKLGKKRWGVQLSKHTEGRGRERYAFFYRRSKLQIIAAQLFSKYEREFRREPYIGKFKTNSGATLVVASFHARPIKQKPQLEIANFILIDNEYQNQNLLIMGDFNYSTSHRSNAFSAIQERGFTACLSGKVKTSLKRKVDSRGRYLSRAYDNILFNKRFVETTGCRRLDLVKKLGSLAAAKSVSDHLPIYGVFRIIK